MKKASLLIISLILSSMAVFAQKYALIDMEYIFSRIPAYEMANDQLNQVSKKWQAEVDALANEAKELYTKYQAEMVYLSDEMKKNKENEILSKEKELADLKRKYFGSEGELYKKRESLLTPIQDEIYNAVRELAEEQSIMLILDRASGVNIVFASPSIDISDQVLKKLGY
ncbi:MAG: OmpH family outer membrane protein [Bacteroidales bacterium]|jgi:outer membrane protein|nr:OmpH family outer membrane protein [Bacteroidales bacterium]MDD2617573.1 OmpH family outer membrane protein [Bacteroidales bacterium]MDD4640301.1 OmpH family outer membrane protein [Bacteroidales bacterium]NLB02721.1 OmpH family outer membrane protein [Bacteroidales bacterium]